MLPIIGPSQFVRPLSTCKALELRIDDKLYGLQFSQHRKKGNDDD